MLPATSHLNASAGGIWLARVLREVRANRIIDSPDLYRKVSSHGTELVLRESRGSASATVERAVITAIGADWIRVRKMADTDNPNLIYVAKPQNLRQSSWSGSTWRGHNVAFPDSQDTMTRRLSRQVQNANNNPVTISIDEYVDPAYVVEENVGDAPLFSEIYIVRRATGVTDPDGNPVRWMDLNTDARSWVRALTHYRFCLDSVERDGILSGGAPV